MLSDPAIKRARGVHGGAIVVKSDVCSETSCLPVKEGPKVYCASELGTRFGPAVVSIKIIPKYESFWPNYNRFAEQVYGPTHFNAGILPMSGTGYFTPNGFIHSAVGFMSIAQISAIVSTFSLPWNWEPGCNEVETCVAAFANPRKCPTPTTPYVNRYPNLPTFADVLRSICNGKMFAQWLEVYVDVTGATGCPTTYRASIFGMDPDTGVLTMRVNPNDPFNSCNEPLTTQGFMKYGNSKGALPGSKVYCIYDSRVSGPKCIASGVVSDNSVLCRDGSVTYEMLGTDIICADGVEGAPIVDECGMVVGTVTGVTEQGQVMAVSSAFSERIFTCLEQAATAGDDCSRFAPWIASMGFRVYRHAKLSMNYHTKSASDINQAFLAVSVGGTGTCADCHECSNGSCSYHKGADYWRKRFYTYQNCNIARDIRGVILDTEPCGDLARATVQCAVSDPNYGQTRTRYVRIEQGDCITHINNVELGSLRHQYSPDTVFFGIEACTCVTIKFRKKSEIYTEEYCLQVKTDDSLDWISSFTPCCKACLAFCPEKLEPSEIIPTILANVGEIFKAVNCYIALIKWFTQMMPQVYRATFYCNFSIFITQLSEWINILVMPMPAGYDPECGPGGATRGVGDKFGALTTALRLKGIDPQMLEAIWVRCIPTPLSVGLTLTSISRACVSVVAIPSEKSAVKPIPFYDFISCFAHPSNSCAFDQIVPNFMAMAGTKLAQYSAAGLPAPTVAPAAAGDFPAA